MALAAPGEVVEADARAAQLDHLVQFSPPVVGRRSAVDLFQRAAGDLAAVDAVEAGAGPALAIEPLAGALVAADVDQADARQVALEMVGGDVATARQPALVAAGRPIGEKLF